MESFTNQTFDEIAVGASHVVRHTVTRDEIDLLSLVSGDVNAFQTEDADGLSNRAASSCESVSAEALLHGVLKRRLPGPGTTIVAHDLAAMWWED